MGVPVDESHFRTISPTEIRSHTLARNLNASAFVWEWSGEGPMRFQPDGTLDSPWGSGSWGTVPSQWRNDSLHVRLGANRTAYLLIFLSEKWAFVAIRCADERVSYGRLRAERVPENRLVW